MSISRKMTGEEFLKHTYFSVTPQMDPRLRPLVMTVRAWNAVLNADLTFDALVATSREDLLKLPNCGRGTVDDIEVALEGVGARLLGEGRPRCPCCGQVIPNLNRT